MAEQTTPLRPAQDVDDIRVQLAERDEEILRLRDLLITRDVELGTAKGRLTAIEHGSQRLSEAATRIPVPGGTRVIHMMIRFIQRALR
jgi:hypothetical protein